MICAIFGTHHFANVQMVRQNNFNRDKLVNEEFGIQVREELALVDARVLPPPTVAMALHFSMLIHFFIFSH